MNFLNELGEKIRRVAVLSILLIFPNDTGAPMQDSIYHMTLNSHFISEFWNKT